ncbi:MAG: ferrochelatase [Deltaproteobacteria bacterium]|nr:ferrochelatase [Deltaproteobacteria bacterium]MDQ3295210.1 ferrochelatase [Myxococcota bacterium]
MPHGLLLINLGTPDDPSTPAVRRYLREFLGDPRVIDINAIGRALLLHLVILPTRPAKSAHAYRTIWDPERGSPLLYHSQDLAAAVATRLGAGWQVELAMRYGKPSIADALARLEQAHVDRVVVLPLFPQYATSSTGTAIARVMELATARWNVPALDFVPAFFDDPGFIAAFEAVAKPALAAARADHVLFSFHGLPVRQIVKTDMTGAHCLKSATCCDTLANPSCYRAQSYATARALAPRLGLTPTQYTVCFQSRLGRTPWIEPYTDVELDRLAKAGVKRLAVLCPAFVADCLETVEEIGIRAREQFKAAGGEELVLVPSLNATPAWVDAVAAIAERHAARKSLPIAG